MFDRRAIVGGGVSHLSLISSGADAIVAKTNDELVALALERSAARRCRRRASRGCARRPRGSREAIDVLAGAGRAAAAANESRRSTGLLLAGDWIETGLPATIESAVISGHRRRGRGRTVDRANTRSRTGRHDLGPAHYSEIALKGKNRPWFVGRLVRNLHGALAGLHVKEVRTPIGRIEIVLGQRVGDARGARSPVARVRHRQLLGRAIHVPLDFEGMAEAVLSRLPPKEAVKSFRVLVRRADQKFPMPSPELARDLGSRVWTARGWKVDLDHADLVISVEIIPGGGVLLHRAARLGRAACRSGTGGRVVASAVGRHRFAGGGVAHDAARLPRHVGALPQRAVSVERLAGEGAAAGRRC